MDNVLEFDSKVTQGDLIHFKFYHKYHTVSGICEILLALVLIVICIMSVGKVNITYTLMTGFLGVFFLVFPPFDMVMRAKRQMQKVVIFKEKVHYKVTDEKISISLGEVTEDLPWDNIYKVKFDGRSIDVYLTGVNANIIPVRDMGEAAERFVEMAKGKLKPFQIKINTKKLGKARMEQ